MFFDAEATGLSLTVVAGLMESYSTIQSISLTGICAAASPAR